MSIKYDFLIVGAGLFGAVFAREITNAGFKCLVIDKRPHIGGNTYCENIEKINVHKYGPHIFHTNDNRIWDYVNSFAAFNNFRYMPMANYQGALYSLPFNMHTFYQLWKTKTPLEAKSIIEQQVRDSGIVNPRNLEEQAILSVGTEIYQKFIKGYTEKQWGKKANLLPASIFKRLNIRFTYDNNYFSDLYQGIPIGGYNKLTEGLLKGIEIKTGVNFMDNRTEWELKAKKILYTGSIDEYYNYRFGNLEYRSLRFEQQTIETMNYQGAAVINYTDYKTPYTRVIEHKHFEFGNQPVTVVTKEIPQDWQKGKEAYYPVNDDRNNRKYQQYKSLASCKGNILFGGRLAEYKYYDMHQVIAAALKLSKEIINQNILQSFSIA